MLDDATRYASSSSVPPSAGAEWAVRDPRLWAAPVPVAQALAADAAPAELAVNVFVSEGRWVVACPDCGGAQLAARDDRRFMCVECANVVAGGLWRPVVWPDDASDIEVELARRPARRTQNWLPGETVDDLVAELEQRSGEVV